MTEKKVHHQTERGAGIALASEAAHKPLVTQDGPRRNAYAAKGEETRASRGPGARTSRGGCRRATENPPEGREAPTAPQDSRTRCLCGCDGTPKGKKSRFVMGHDAKLRSELAAQI